jgi:hypothetical protein
LISTNVVVSFISSFCRSRHGVTALLETQSLSALCIDANDKLEVIRRVYTSDPCVGDYLASAQTKKINLVLGTPRWQAQGR